MSGIGPGLQGGAFTVPGITGGQAPRRNSTNTGWEGYTPTGGSYSLPTATASVLGGVKVGDNLSISNAGVLSADDQSYTLPAATSSVLGGVKIGTGVTVAADGTISVSAGGTYTLPAATDSALGGVKIGTGVTVGADGTISVAVPSKASAQEIAAATDDSKFVTPLQLRNAEKSVDDGTTWTGFAYVSGTPAAGQWTVTRTNATGYEFTFVGTDAQATEMDEILGRNSHFFVRVNDANVWSGEIDYPWRVSGTNQIGFRAKANLTETGDVRSGTASLQATGPLYEDLKEQGFLTSGDLVQGTNITLTTGSNGRVTIAATGGGGGGTFATQGTATAGTSTNTIMSPATTHGVIEHLAHVAEFTGLTNAGSPNDQAVGTWHINSGGTTAYFRAHTANEFELLKTELLVDRYFILRNSAGQRIEAKFSAVQINDVSGSDIDVIQCTIGDHSATPASPTLTGDWSLTILPEQNEQILENAPKGSIPLIALATQPGGQARTLSANGNSDIGLTTFGDVSDTVWNSITATNSNLLPVPHPNSASTPSGTGEVTFTPRSASSTFATAINIGFGWLGDHNVKVHFLLARKIGNGSWTVVDGSKKFNVLNGNYGAVDFNVTPIAFDSPNTTEQVTYRWMIVRGDVSGGGNNGRVYPIAQTAIFIEIPNM